MSDLSLLLRGYAAAVDDEFRPVDADELRRRELAPPPAIRGARVIDLRRATRHRYLMAAAAAVLVLLIGGIAFAHRGTRDPSRVDTTGDSTVITGPTTSTSTSVPPCPSGAATSCAEVPGTGPVVPGTTENGSVVPGTSEPGPAPSSTPDATGPPGGPASSVPPVPPVTVPSASFPPAPSIPVLPRTTTTARPVTTTTSSSTTTTVAPTTGRLRGHLTCTTPCTLSSFALTGSGPTLPQVTVPIDANGDYDVDLPPNSGWALGRTSPCTFVDDGGNQFRGFAVVAGGTYRYDLTCTPP